MSLPVPAYISTVALAGKRPVKMDEEIFKLALLDLSSSADQNVLKRSEVASFRLAAGIVILAAGSGLKTGGSVKSGRRGEVRVVPTSGVLGPGGWRTARLARGLLGAGISTSTASRPRHASRVEAQNTRRYRGETPACGRKPQPCKVMNVAPRGRSILGSEYRLHAVEDALQHSVFAPRAGRASQLFCRVGAGQASRSERASMQRPMEKRRRPAPGILAQCRRITRILHVSTNRTCSAAPNYELPRRRDGKSLLSVKSSAGMQGRGKRKVPEKTRRPAASSSTIPTCEISGATPPGFELGPPWWEASVILRETSSKLQENGRGNAGFIRFRNFFFPQHGLSSLRRATKYRGICELRARQGCEASGESLFYTGVRKTAAKRCLPANHGHSVLELSNSDWSSQARNCRLIKIRGQYPRGNCTYDIVCRSLAFESIFSRKSGAAAFRTYHKLRFSRDLLRGMKCTYHKLRFSRDRPRGMKCTYHKLRFSRDPLRGMMCTYHKLRFSRDPLRGMKCTCHKLRFSRDPLRGMMCTYHKLRFSRDPLRGMKCTYHKLRFSRDPPRGMKCTYHKLRFSRDPPRGMMCTYHMLRFSRDPLRGMKCTYHKLRFSRHPPRGMKYTYHKLRFSRDPPRGMKCTYHKLRFSRDPPRGMKCTYHKLRFSRDPLRGMMCTYHKLRFSRDPPRGMMCTYHMLRFSRDPLRGMKCIYHKLRFSRDPPRGMKCTYHKLRFSRDPLRGMKCTYHKLRFSRDPPRGMMCTYHMLRFSRDPLRGMKCIYHKLRFSRDPLRGMKCTYHILRFSRDLLRGMKCTYHMLRFSRDPLRGMKCTYHKLRFSRDPLRGMKCTYHKLRFSRDPLRGMKCTFHKLRFSRDPPRGMKCTYHKLRFSRDPLRGMKCTFKCRPHVFIPKEESRLISYAGDLLFVLRIVTTSPHATPLTSSSSTPTHTPPFSDNDLLLHPFGGSEQATISGGAAPSSPSPNLPPRGARPHSDRNANRSGQRPGTSGFPELERPACHTSLKHAEQYSNKTFPAEVLHTFRRPGQNNWKPGWDSNPRACVPERYALRNINQTSTTCLMSLKEIGHSLAELILLAQEFSEVCQTYFQPATGVGQTNRPCFRKHFPITRSEAQHVVAETQIPLNSNSHSEFFSPSPTLSFSTPGPSKPTPPRNKSSEEKK
ncbi:hypothetical protein PR048_030827 [Dryococelus australis]|uniref:Uncharacterized protein n=1 Tax=Dryococelus australis TaxID=614101 RepID=A0ABQ9GA08_9NEOP|nr:hypothetical protein PR048_030827 [Dryococelus australis]